MADSKHLLTNDGELSKSLHFYRAITVNMTFGAEVLRQLAEKCLKAMGISLKKLLKDTEVQDWFHKNDLIEMKASNTLADLDVQKLTILLLHALHLTDDDCIMVNKLRLQRNKLAHSKSAELDDDSVFNESSHLVIDLAKSIGLPYATDVTGKVKEIKSRQIVQPIFSSERILLCNEYYMMQLVKHDVCGKESSVTPNALAVRIRYGLTKFTRQILSGLKNVGMFLRKLKDENIIDDGAKRSIELAYSQEDKVGDLILHLVNALNDHDIIRASACLREFEPNGGLLAAMVEDTCTGDDGNKIIGDYVDKKINDILKQSLEKCTSSESVETSAVHLIVERKLGRRLDFNVIRDVVIRYFEIDKPVSGSFFGLKWKSSVDISGTSGCPSSLKQEGKREEVNFTDMCTEDFAKYLDKRMLTVSEECEGKFEYAIKKESCSVQVFKDLTEDEKERFARYIKPVTYGLGISKMLTTIQRQIANQFSEPCPEGSVYLRPFDKPANRETYKRGYTKPVKGNLLVPTHEFRCRSPSEHYTSSFIAKEVVIFAAACINGRQNGTLHFGISRMNEETGQIIGIPSNCTCYRSLPLEIEFAIKTCFKEKAAMANLCVRPVQTIPVDDCALSVLEVDIVPVHFYLEEDLIPIYIPPKGYQQKQYAIYNREIQLSDNEKGTSSISSKRLENRKRLDQLCETEKDCGNQKESRLKHILTQGNKYVTPFFSPIFFTGNLSGCSEIRRELDIEHALTSADMVLDFDTSSALLEKVEKNGSSFLIKTAENLRDNNDGEIYKKKLWIHVNGYEKSGNEQERNRMDIKKWQSERSVGIKKALEELRKQSPKGAYKVIFLVFQAYIGKGRDPMLEIARDAFLYTFRGECIVIAENDFVLKEWRKELEQFDIAFDDIFLTGLKWDAVSNVMKIVFRANPDIECILPCTDGSHVVMTSKEIHPFTDIEIVSGEECMHEINKQSGEKEVHDQVKEAQDNFYQGKGITWWNFYFEGQVVGKRSCFDYHAIEIENKITTTTGKELVEEYNIYHYPGAGGTTLGRHLLWYFSQFSGRRRNIYRCCILKTFTENNTSNQLEEFRIFKEKDEPNPFIILLDNQPDEIVNHFRRELKEFAYLHTAPGNLFCLLLNVIRIPISTKAERRTILTHQLSDDERRWFENKYSELEKKHNFDGYDTYHVTDYLDSLIAFNFMKNSFDQVFIQSTTERLMKGIKQDNEDGEKGVLKCLAIVGAFGNESHPIPIRVFDVLMEDNRNEGSCKSNLTFGMMHALRERKKQRVPEITWNLTMSNAMNSMVAEREYGEYGKTGLCIICQPLAIAIIDSFAKDKTDLKDLVLYLFDLVREFNGKNDRMSLEFTKIVSRLFIERQKSIANTIRDRDHFSVLIIALRQQGEDKKIAEKTVASIMQRYLEITNDPMIGQQLARYNISIHEYEAAKEAIVLSIETAPSNSYIHDTYGQVLKMKMEYLFKMCEQKERSISDEDAAVIIELAFDAVEQFKVGQKKAIQEDKMSFRPRNMSSFIHEIRTAVELLENFKSFKSYQDRLTFLQFLNDESFEVDETPFKSLANLCAMRDLRRGSDFQTHLEESLKDVEDRQYQIKYDVFTDDGENVLNLRERLERYYGDRECTSKPHLNCPLGFAPLMDMLSGKNRDKVNTVVTRANQAEDNIKNFRLTDVDDRDFIVYLGYQISIMAVSDRNPCLLEDYCKMLSYSAALLKNHTYRYTGGRSKHKLDGECNRRMILEVFLYHAMLHWPIESRTSIDFEDFCPPKKFQRNIDQWEKAFRTNHHITSDMQRNKNKPKTFFALGNGSPGNDIVHLKTIEERWKNETKAATGRSRIPTAGDEFWKEEYYQKELKWMNGIVNGSGKALSYEVEYPQGRHSYDIRLIKNNTGLSNREVTFALGFTWAGPIALFVEEKTVPVLPLNPSSPPTSTLIGTSNQQATAVQGDRDVARAGSHGAAAALSTSVGEVSGKHLPPEEKKKYITITTAEQSRGIIENLCANPPHHLVISCVGQMGISAHMIVIHSQTDAYMYHLEEGNKELFKDGHVDKLLLNKDISKVFLDIRAASTSLINEYDILMDGTPLWDIEMVCKKAKENVLQEAGVTDVTFTEWRNQDSHYATLVSQCKADEVILDCIVEQGNRIWQVFEICERNLDEVSRRSLRREIYEAAFSGNSAKVGQLKLQKKELAASKQKEGIPATDTTIPHKKRKPKGKKK